MSYTTLRVSARGVVLFESHAARLGPAARPEFERFAASATSGIYSLHAQGDVLRVEARGGSRLTEGLSVRTEVSPVIDRQGAFAKPAPPSPYEPVRRAMTTTLLTDAAGAEVYESCVASVLAWDGASLILVPHDRPRVASVAETFVERHFYHRRAPIRTDSDWGLMLINAVASVPLDTLPGRRPFSIELYLAIQNAIEATAARL